ncbi:MAG: DUF359 domain-containing protein [Aigarchaeota archaeon]|nr:DUF359 domain-containing protein [Aigarchaeota archaeon]MDW7986814.1 DUF359 domain-containing protein [Nitrososphaerota archaeon]
MNHLLWPPRVKIVFTEEMKEKVREPIGELIRGEDPDEVTLKLGKLIKEYNPPIVVAVGDYISSKLYQHKIRVDVYVIDGKIERVEKTSEIVGLMKVVETVNDAGTISPQSAEKLHSLIHSPEDWPIILKIDGEEDLLGLAAILSSPKNAIVVYGQPKKGAVLVRVSDDVKKKIIEIIGESVSR